MKRKIYIAGHNGMVGSAIKKSLIAQGETNIVTRSKSELDLSNQALVKDFFRDEKPEQVYLAAAKVGGILANNTYPAEFIYENLMIQSNIIHFSFMFGVKELLFLGSSCIYPKFAEQPMKEDLLLTGSLESTNEPYAIAKIAGIKLCESYNRQYSESHGLDYRSVMPTNLYGPGDNYSLEYSHVIPALIRRFHEAKIKGDEKVVVWGSGNIRREFLYVEDLAKAAIHVMGLSKEDYYKHTSSMCSHINVGSGSDLSIKELADEIKQVIGYTGRIEYDTNMPDGMPRKLLNTKLINKLGWKPEKKLREGLKDTYKFYVTEQKKVERSNLDLDKNNVSQAKNNFFPNFKYPLVKSSWDKMEYQAIQNVIASENFTMGIKVSEFEKEFSNYIGSKYSIMSNSGSSANLLMVASLFYRKKNKLKKGDEVIVPAVSWSTSFFPLYQYGLHLKFVDIDLNTLNYKIEDLNNAVSDKTKVILAVNLLGNPNDFKAIQNIIGKRKIILIEDSCQAMGAEYNGKKTGTFGLLGTFSSFFSHHINTMEGGLTVTDDEELYQIMLSLRAHGWTRGLPTHNKICDRSNDPFRESFRFVLPGYNLRPLEFAGALGLKQIEKLPSLIKARRKNSFLLKQALHDHPTIQFQHEIGLSSWFGFSLLIKPNAKVNRKTIIEKLNNSGFETRPISAGNFTKNDVLNYFDYQINGELKNADYIDENGLVIGNNHLDMADTVDILRKILM